MIHEAQKRDKGYEIYIKSLLIQLLIFTERYLKNNQAPSRESSGSIDDKITEILHYMNENYNAEDLSLQDTAERFYIRSNYLSRIFKKVTGFTYTEYLNHIRIHKAQRILKELNQKVIDIVDHIGFNSLIHFGKVFKEITHYTPSAYRKIHRV